MKLCTKHGCGVCDGCSQMPPDGYGDVCRYKAEWMLDCLIAIVGTELTYEQTEILADFAIEKDDTE